MEARELWAWGFGERPGVERGGAKRGVIAPVFATRKPARGFRRWTERGRENLRTPGARRCTAFNLQKRYQHGAAARLGAAPQLAAA